MDGTQPNEGGGDGVLDSGQVDAGINAAGGQQQQDPNPSAYGNSMMQGESTFLGSIKQHKNQVENDVKLLRNRVRMLQVEHEKAQKKVNDTAKKTHELVQLRVQNDVRFQETNAHVQNRQNEHRAKQEQHYAQSMDRKRQVKEAKLGMYMGKRAGVQSVRDKLRQDLQRKKEFEQMEIDQRAQKRQQIRDMAENGRYKIQAYQQSKMGVCKLEQKQKTEHEKRLIYKYEKEAQDLENEEEKLILRLQDLQTEEKMAFADLESCMVTASLAKRDRLQIVQEVSQEQLYPAQQQQQHSQKHQPQFQVEQIIDVHAEKKNSVDEE